MSDDDNPRHRKTSAPAWVISCGILAPVLWKGLEVLHEIGLL
ncbi:hypothetical protein [Paraoerskovia sediminicola]|nr:hypothetical protein [Paraoerskovia sediminicola]